LASIGRRRTDCTRTVQHTTSQRARQRVHELPEEEVVGIGRSTRVGVHLPVEDEDLARAEALAQMVVGASVAEPELEDRPLGHVARPRGEIDAGALRFQAPDEAVEA